MSTDTGTRPGTAGEPVVEGVEPEAPWRVRCRRCWAWALAAYRAARDSKLASTVRRVNRQGPAFVRLLVVAIWLRALWPALVESVQTPRWGVWWQRTIDKACRWRPQVLALGGEAALWALTHWDAGMWSLSLLFGDVAVWPLLGLVVSPAAAITSAAVGRKAYPHVPRRKARALFTRDAGPDAPTGTPLWATAREVREHASPYAARTIARRTRPSIAERVRDPATGVPSDWALARMPISETGTWQGHVAVGMPFGTPIVTPHEGNCGYIAAPRSWKTAHMGNGIVDHYGPCLSTQTRPETYKQTRQMRKRRSKTGRVHLFDPEGTTGEASTFHWSPVSGCADPTVAMERAAAMAGAARTPGENGEWFIDKAATILRCLLLAADVYEGAGMVEVASWASLPPEAMRKEIVPLLVAIRDRVPAGWIEAMTGTLDAEAGKTRDAVLMVLSGAVGFMADPVAAKLCTLGERDVEFDVASFLAGWETVYLIATEREWAPIGPLVAAFAQFVFTEAKKIADKRTPNRLDPVLFMSLDEVANTIAMPLHVWLTLAGGSGIHINWSAQSRSQLRQRWGPDGADTVWNATTTKLVGGGLTVEEDLDALARLCTRRFKNTKGEWVLFQLLTQAEIRELPRWHALCLHGSMPVTIVRLSPVWARADVIASWAVPWEQPEPLAPVVELTGAPAPLPPTPTETSREAA